MTDGQSRERNRRIRVMKKFSKFQWKTVAAGAMAAAMCMTGCGEAAAPAASSAAPAESTVAASTAAASTAAASTTVETKDVTLTVWGPQEDQVDDTSWLPTECKAFAAEHPEWNITFNYAVCAEGDAGTNVTKDPTAAGDVYMFANDQLGALIDANAIAELGGDAAQAVKDNNTDTMVASVTATDGGIYGVPFTGNTWFMYYDKSVFSDDDVKNLDTMLSKGKVSFPITNSWYVASFFVANGGTLFGEDGTDADAGIQFGGDAGTAVTKYMVNMVKNKNFSSDADGSGLAGLRDGSVNAIFSGTWDAEAVKEALGDNYAAAQLPTITVDGSDKQLMSFAGSKAIAVNPNCKDPDVAVALASYLGSADAQKAHYTMRNIIPCDKSLASDVDVEKDPAALAQTNTIANTSILQPTISAMSQFWTPTENFGKSLANGEITEDNAAEKTEAFNKSFTETLN